MTIRMPSYRHYDVNTNVLSARRFVGVRARVTKQYVSVFRYSMETNRHRIRSGNDQWFPVFVFCFPLRALPETPRGKIVEKRVGQKHRSDTIYRGKITRTDAVRAPDVSFHSSSKTNNNVQSDHVYIGIVCRRV